MAESNAFHNYSTIPDLSRRIEALLERKRKMESEQKSIEAITLLEFLKLAKATKTEELNKLNSELSRLSQDIIKLDSRIKRDSGFSNEATNTEANLEVPVIQEEVVSLAKRPHLEGNTHSNQDYMASSSHTTTNVDISSILKDHFDDLQASYFTDSTDDPLESFGQKISKLSRYTRIRQLSALRLSDLAGSSNIISSIEFDRDGKVFATAGVSKKIKFYEYRDALKSFLDVHCPIHEIPCKSKLSCISWNPYVPHQLASADYEGLITVYDVNTTVPVYLLEEHEKRCWSVDYSSTDPTRLASGSDDCFVKLWSTKSKKSICTIDGKANICSIKFHPDQGHLLAFGSADHNVHYYDLRYYSRPLDILKSHKKAVSYVRFIDSFNLISASTDCTLKRWKFPGHESSILPSATTQLDRTFAGHVNEKNFVGLGVQGDLIACGSENNSVYLYHKDLSKPLATFRFPSICPLTESLIENEVQQFVSSLCWKQDTNIIVAANSQGNIRILEVV